MKVKKTTKTTTKKTKKSKGKSEEPMVKVLSVNVNPENPRNGFFELDWNKEFVNMLQQNGYTGDSEEQIVDTWFQSLCRTIGNEQGIGDVTGGYVQINRRPDGKTEVS
jgi:hypothetical protein|tara:strand:- start:1383 stop:1706 length:324 start_codon:yes stop_codon:yes gene_type:complete